MKKININLIWLALTLIGCSLSMNARSYSGGAGILGNPDISNPVHTSGIGELENVTPAIYAVANSPFFDESTNVAPSNLLKNTDGNGVVHVNSKVAGGNNDGTSWANAFTYLQDALALARTNTDVEQIWVAAGVYYPDEGAGLTNNDRTATFNLVEGVKLYGGFSGTETALSQRDIAANPTILSGDIDGNDTNTDGNFISETTADIVGDNAFHVVTADGTGAVNITTATEINGFTVTAGNANDNYPYDMGGGIYCSGYGNGKKASPSIINCQLIGNFANSGGGIFNEGNQGESSPEIINCSFLRNKATNGGAIYNMGYSGNSNPLIKNCSFYGNYTEFGGAIHNLGSSGNSNPVITNCILWGDTATDTGDEIYNSFATPTISYSNIAGSGGSGSGWDTGLGTDGGNNIDSDPLFVDAPNGDLRICGISPCADAGNDAANAEPTDIRGGDFARKLDKNNSTLPGTIDMGAYEYKEGTDPLTTRLYVNTNVSGGNNDGTSWDNAFAYLQDALALARTNTDVEQIWVAAGVYYPDEGAGQTDNDRTATFSLVEGVKLYGGFSGTETVLSQRDIAANPTILSGDIDGNDTNTDGNTIAETTADIVGDNAFHVVTADGTGAVNITTATEVNGFVITAGNANGPDYYDKSGGGLFSMADGAGSIASPSVIQCSFIGNGAEILGGAILNYAYYGTSSPTISNCSFSSNIAGFYGGAINNYSGVNGVSSPTISNCSFNANSAGNDGGAIYNSVNKANSSPTITNCSFIANSAGYSGGAIYNSAENGICSPSITNCSFSANSAGYFGGAISNWANGNGTSSPLLTSCSFNANIAGNNGGSVYNYASAGIGDPSITISSPSITNCSFSANSAGDNGGAIYNEVSSGTCSPVITNCSFYANNAVEKGGSIYNSGSAWSTCSPTLTNCILWGNTAQNAGAEIFNDNATPTLSYSNIAGSGGSGSSWDNNLGTDGGNNIDSDPMFVDAANGDLRIFGISPCADAGNNAANAEPTDIRGGGFTRKLDKNNSTVPGTIDMGAFEYKEGTDPIEPCANPTDGGTIAASRTICSGTTPESFTSVSLPTAHSGTIEYNWQICTITPTFEDIPEATSQTYTHVGTVTQTTWFRRLARVDCMDDWSGAASSNVLEIAVNSPGPVTRVNIRAEKAEGGMVKFTATPVNGGAKPYYRWYKIHGATQTLLAEGENVDEILSTCKSGDEHWVELTSSIPCTADAKSNAMCTY